MSKGLPPKLSILDARLAQSLSIVGSIATLIITPWTSLDPIAIPKMIVIVTLGFWILGLVVSNLDLVRFVDPTQKWFLTLNLLFVVWMVAVLFQSKAPLNQQFWGMFGRNTGVLAYTGLVLCAIGACLIKTVESRKKVLNSFLITSIPINLYCFIQILGKDPIKWSELNTFATLGNVNFLSAFLGMISTFLVLLAFDREKKMSVRILYVLWSLISLSIIWSTGSIQGVMIFGAGILIGLVVVSYRSTRRKLYLPLLLVFSSFFLFETIRGLMNLGILRSIIYQPSVIFRGDYIHAGWEMTRTHPLFGVGMDSYGDWYRSLRGEISTLRTGPNRIANTAHNIFLDISSNGGIPLIGLYLLSQVIVFYCAFRYLRNRSKYDFYFVSLFSTWCAYQIQALVSINQLGVGIWGWLMSGLLISYGVSATEPNQDLVPRDFRNSKIQSKRLKQQLLPAKTILISTSLAVLGFFASLVPYQADANYRAATGTKEGERIIASLKSPAITAWHYNLAIDSLVASNLPEQAKSLTVQLTQRFPRDYYGWKMLSILTNVTESERSTAKIKLKELDPFNSENG